MNFMWHRISTRFLFQTFQPYFFVISSHHSGVTRQINSFRAIVTDQSVKTGVWTKRTSPLTFLTTLLPHRTMKLLTHNMLTSKSIKGVQEGYPLKLKVDNLEVKESEFNEDFIVRLLPKLQYNAIYSAAKDAGKADDLPEMLPEDAASSKEFLRKLHHVLLEIEIVTGELVCPETGRVFPIQNGIPNMLLTSQETV